MGEGRCWDLPLDTAPLGQHLALIRRSAVWCGGLNALRDPRLLAGPSDHSSGQGPGQGPGVQSAARGSVALSGVCTRVGPASLFSVFLDLSQVQGLLD